MPEGSAYDWRAAIREPDFTSGFLARHQLQREESASAMVARLREYAIATAYVTSAIQSSTRPLEKAPDLEEGF